MRKLIGIILLICSTIPCVAEQTKTIFNPFTGKLDYITALSTNSVKAGANVVVTTTSSGVQVSASTGSSLGDITDVNAGAGILVTNSTGPAPTVSVNYSTVASRGDVILNQNTLQSGATFFTSSGSVQGQFRAGVLVSTSSLLRNNSFSIFEANGSGNILRASGGGITYKTDSSNQLLFIGANAGSSYVTGSGLVYIGPDSGFFANDVIDNTFIGSGAGTNGTTGGDDNVYIGKNAGFSYTTGNKNVFIGNGAGYGSPTPVTTGLQNVFIGYNAGASGLQPQGSSAIGYNATVARNNAMVLGDPTNSSFNIGIGTNNPIAKLDVYGLVRSTGVMITGLLSQGCVGTDANGNIQAGSCSGGGGSPLEVFNNFDGTRSSPTLSIGLSSAFNGTVSGSTYTISLSSIEAGGVVFGGTTGNLLTHGASIYFNNSNARLGLGTTSPLFTLDIRMMNNNGAPTVITDNHNTSPGWQAYQFFTSTNNLVGPTNTFVRANGTLSAPLPLQDTDGIGHIFFRSYRTSALHSISAAIESFSEGGSTTTSTPGNLSWSTTPQGSTNPVQRVILHSTGTLSMLTLAPGPMFVIAGSSDVKTGLVSLSTDTTGTLDISAQTNLAVTSPITLTNDTVGISAISLSTGTVGSVDISTQTNLAVTGPIVLTNDTLSLSLISLSTGVTGSLPAASIAAGSLGASVIASSIAINSVLDASIVSVSASKVTGVNLPAGSSTYAQVNPGTVPQAGAIYMTSGTVQNLNNSTFTATASANGQIFNINNSTGSPVVTVNTTPAGLGSIFQVQDSTGRALVTFNGAGHIVTASTQPTVSSCGTGPTVDSTSDDVSGFITTGSGVFSSCTLTFANAYANKPSCVIEDDTSVLTSPPKVTTTTTTMIVSGVTITAGDVINYICMGK